MALLGRPFARATAALLLASAAATARSSPPPPVAPPLPAVEVRLSVSESGPDEQWQLKLENVSDTKVRVADEPRLLWFEVVLPGQKPRTCRLPDDLFPKTTSEKSTKELTPGESLVRRIDPRFYCFSATHQETLVPGAQVTPHFGWPSKAKPKWHKGHVEEKLSGEPPFAVEPVGSESLGPAKNLVGDPVVLDSRYAVWSTGPAESETKADEEGEEPAVEIVRGSDARDEMAVTATVRVKNPGRSRVTVFVRRELLTFQVMTPKGSMTCASEPDKRNPDRRAFTTLSPHGSMTLVSRLVEFCPRGTFATPGLYLVRAQLDADVDGSDYGLDAFTGTLQTEKPVTVRVRRAIQIVPNRRLLQGGAPGAPSVAVQGMPNAPPAGMALPTPAAQPAPPPPPPPAPPAAEPSP